RAWGLLAVALLGGLAPWASPLEAQAPRYSLDDWMTVSRVQSFVWAPDGSAIYYTSNEGESGTYDVFRKPLDGGDPTRLGRTPPGVRPEPKESLSISADGSTLVFTSARLFQSYENIYTMPAAGGEPVPVTFNDARIHAGPALSPDGRELAYFARTGAATRIFVKDLTRPGSWPRLLLPESSDERSPVWSPDGSTVAFSRGGDIWITSGDGGEARRVVEAAFAGGNGSPVWSPDGTRLAFTSGRSGYGQVGVVEVATGRVTPITLAPREHGDPDWSPDGRSIVFVRSDSTGFSTHVVVAPADGSGPTRRLTEGFGVRSAPQYAPDGRSIAYLETTGTRTADVWRIPAEGGAPEQVTRSMG